MKPLFARIHTVLAWLIFLGCALLIYLIALAYFGGVSASMHGEVGRILFVLSLLMLIASLICRSSRLNIILSSQIPLMLFAQGMFIHMPSLPPIARALHALNGLTIMVFCYLLANGRARATVENPSSAAAGLAGD
jgi:hypothetical protein